MTRLLQGAAAGFLATVVIGFSLGGWTGGNTAKQMAEKSAANAVVVALAAICVANFQHSAEAATNLIELKKVSVWRQAAFISKGGWATMPGSDAANPAVAEACASMISGVWWRYPPPNNDPI